MSGVSVQRRVIAWWYVILIAASVLFPFFGGLLVLIATRLRRFREHSPSLKVLAIIWIAITAIQIVALFVSLPFSTSVETLVG